MKRTKSDLVVERLANTILTVVVVVPMVIGGAPFWACWFAGWALWFILAVEENVK